VVLLKGWLISVKIQFLEADLHQYTSLCMFIFAAVVYLHYFWLLPTFYYTQRFWTFAFLLLALISLGSYLIIHLDAWYLRGNNFDWMLHPWHWVSKFPGFIFYILLITWPAISEELMRRQMAEKQLQAERTEAELKWLKAQVNPHFLFNALNNIHSLVHFKEDNAGPMLVKLSNMMRYIFFDTNHPKITLAKELEHLDNYIELNLLKKKYQQKVKFEKQIEHSNILIEPMLFINFIENAFKHGNLDKDDAFINIDLVANNQSIHFNCSNSHEPTGTKDALGGIGLENIQKRLKLIYPKQHVLTTHDDGSVYTVGLQINLSS
jgi:two-component system, LytTR family, sensor histidine kinase AlgZ